MSFETVTRTRGPLEEFLLSDHDRKARESDWARPACRRRAADRRLPRAPARKAELSALSRTQPNYGSVEHFYRLTPLGARALTIVRQLDDLL